MENTLRSRGRDLVGSVIASLVRDGSLPGDSVEEMLELLWHEGKAWAVCCGRPWSSRVWDKNTLHMTGLQFPYLDEIVKAGYIGSIVLFLYDYCRCKETTHEQKLRAVALWGAAEMLAVLRGNSLLLPDDAASRAAGSKLLDSQSWMRVALRDCRSTCKHIDQAERRPRREFCPVHFDLPVCSPACLRGL
jgi:hypothetical protein